jgi:outer membrane immunogenic protein
MRRATLLLTGAVFLGSTAITAAADLGSYKDEPVITAYGPSWGGLYIGASVGFGVGDTSHEFDIQTDLVNVDDEDGPLVDLIEGLLSGGHDLNGAVYGAHLGYNWQMNKTVFGVEVGIFGSEIDGEDDFGPLALFNAKTDLEYYGRLIGRVGYAEGSTLFYGFGGLAWGDVTTTFSLLNVAEIAEVETDHVGWTAGVGLEHAFNDRFSVRVEYAHVDLGEESEGLGELGLGDLGSIGFAEKVDVEFDTIKVGASYKLFGPERGLESYK